MADRIDNIMDVQIFRVGMHRHHDLEIAPLFQSGDIFPADMKSKLRRKVVPCVETLYKVRILSACGFSEHVFCAYHILIFTPDQTAVHIDEFAAVCFCGVFYIINDSA